MYARAILHTQQREENVRGVAVRVCRFAHITSRWLCEEGGKREAIK